MDIYATIIDSLKKEYGDGATYQELAKKYNVSFSYVRELLLGIKPIERMSLETFFKLFPRAAITLNGNVVAASIGGTNNSTYGNKVIGHIDHYNGAEDKALDAARKKIIDKILESDLDDTVKVKIMRLLNK